MNAESVTAVYFSPTGTTRAVVDGIARGVNPGRLRRLDITPPEARTRSLSIPENELLIIGVPVYMGRVPDLLSDWLSALQGHDTPTVCVVVYGNRAYENALLELTDIVSSRGCVPIAGAAFIGEHSFSDAAAPVAWDRPDAADLGHAVDFGQRIREKLQQAPSPALIPVVQVPGTRPYGGITQLWDVDFIAVSDDCTQCGTCAEVCPMSAIDPQDSAAIDPVKCITCCACIKGCPEEARTMKTGPVKDAQQRLLSLHKEPKQPECFV